MFAKWTERLPDRDRRVLGVALPVVALLAALLLLKPVLENRRAAEQRLEVALDNIAWLQARHRQVAAPVCESAPAAAAPRELASRFGVELGEPDGDRLVIRGGAGNDVLAFLRALACSDAGLDSFRLETAETGGRVRGEARLDRSGV